MLFLPWPIRSSSKCDRCGLRYLDSEGYCYHCHGLTNSEVKLLQDRVRQEYEAHRLVGTKMLFLCAVAVALVFSAIVIAFLNI